MPEKTPDTTTIKVSAAAKAAEAPRYHARDPRSQPLARSLAVARSALATAGKLPVREKGTVLGYAVARTALPTTSRAPEKRLGKGEERIRLLQPYRRMPFVPHPGQVVVRGRAPVALNVVLHEGHCMACSRTGSCWTGGAACVGA